jgi:hypothetical protein
VNIPFISAKTSLNNLGTAKTPRSQRSNFDEVKEIVCAPFAPLASLRFQNIPKLARIFDDRKDHPGGTGARTPSHFVLSNGVDDRIVEPGFFEPPPTQCA